MYECVSAPWWVCTWISEGVWDTGCLLCEHVAKCVCASIGGGWRARPCEPTGCISCNSPTPGQVAQTGLSLKQAFNDFGSRRDWRREGGTQAAGMRRQGSRLRSRVRACGSPPAAHHPESHPTQLESNPEPTPSQGPGLPQGRRLGTHSQALMFY